MLTQYTFSNAKVTNEVVHLQEAIRDFNRDAFKKSIAKLEDMLS